MTTKFKFSLVLVVLLPMTLPSCKEEWNPAEDHVSIYECQQKNNFDEAATRKHIIGTWEWKYTAGGHFSPTSPPDTEVSKGLKVKFNADGSGTIMAKDTSGAFTWTIEIKDNNLYGFKTIPSIRQLPGRLLFCDDQMMCSNSYIDGADNLFKKE